MPFVPFRDHFREIADHETRTITVLAQDPGMPPPGEYALCEMYCDEPGCDCRRVFFWVASPEGHSPAAVVSWGWEPAEFYTRWIRGTDPKIGEEMKGPFLNPGSPQSRHAPKILRMIEELVLTDELYVDRLKRHYKTFRRHIDQPKKGKRKGRKR